MRLTPWTVLFGCLLATPALAQRPPAPDSEACLSLQDISLATRDGRNLLDVFDLLLPGREASASLEGATPVRPLDRMPAIADVRAFGRLLDRYFPEALLRRQIGGTTELLFLSRPDGSMERVGVLRSSGYPDLDNASVRLLQEVKLAPGMMGGCPVWALGRMPIRWTPPAPAAPYGVPYGAQ